ncbi:MAG: nucleoside triphosphate pyrophosphohydrolase [Bacteroidales bacterium]|nr:nucleoside triphosphate pyrophosphohydrolase [Bacteroidales bacterium]
MSTREEKMEAFGRLLDVMDTLREKCPWDAKQTNESLRPNTIEECFELCDALMKEDNKEICKELGDVLLHVVFYAKIGSEKGEFDIADVCNKLCDKLIFRHPHVYKTTQAQTPQPPEGGELDGESSAALPLQGVGGSGLIEVNSANDVSLNWEKIKQMEKDGNKTVLSGVPNALPSLIKAYRIQDKARNVGFDWDKREDVWDKVREEMQELQVELEREDKEKSTDEFGDFLFSLINAARLYHINPDNALERTNKKFIARFNYVEQKTKEQGKELKDMTLAEMDALWNEAKKVLKK